MFNSSCIPLFCETYQNAGFALSDYGEELESKDYAAARFKLNNLSIVFREAKTTPTKTGQFVTLWKRSTDGPIQPFGLTDKIDYYIIGVRNDHNYGHFILSQRILIEQKILKTDQSKGKLAIRVYAPWDATNSKHAANTKKWQLNCFVEFSPNKYFDYNKIKNLLSKK